MQFDPYWQWLRIPPGEQPPNHYRLLGVADFENDLVRIQEASLDVLARLRAFQTGKNSELSQRLMNEVSRAVLVLRDPHAKAHYDHELIAQRRQLADRASRRQRLWRWGLVGFTIGLVIAGIAGLWGFPRLPKEPPTALFPALGAAASPPATAESAPASMPTANPPAASASQTNPALAEKSVPARKGPAARKESSPPTPPVTAAKPVIAGLKPAATTPDAKPDPARSVAPAPPIKTNQVASKGTPPALPNPLPVIDEQGNIRQWLLLGPVALRSFDEKEDPRVLKNFAKTLLSRRRPIQTGEVTTIGKRNLPATWQLLTDVPNQPGVYLALAPFATDRMLDIEAELEINGTTVVFYVDGRPRWDQANPKGETMTQTVQGIRVGRGQHTAAVSFVVRQGPPVLKCRLAVVEKSADQAELKPGVITPQGTSPARQTESGKGRSTESKD